MYSRKKMVEMLELAKMLNLQDDAAHWKSEIERYDAMQSVTTVPKEN